jgi:hypothetical protein
VNVRRASALIALLTVLGAGRAEAFVRSKTDAGNPFFWKENCVPITIYLNKFDTTSGMSSNQIIKSVTAAAHAWSTDAVSCTSGGVTTSPYLEIVPTVAPPSATPPPEAWDARNSIIFRTEPETWSRSGAGKSFFPTEALAVTTVTARSDGHIVDVDMEINGVNMQWMNFDPGVTAPFVNGGPEIFDLQNALTHEFGHFIGLDHTCFIPSDTNPAVGTDGKLRPNDDKGFPVPFCGIASPPEVQTSVMYNVTGPGETNKRVLSTDDINAVCAIYPAANDPGICTLDTANPGCAVAPARPAGRAGRGLALGVPVGALAIVIAMAARRRAARA